MENALLIGLSRQVALGHELDMIANNIANIDTNGFKADKTVFSDFLAPRASDQNFNGRDRQINFVEDRATYIDMAPGSIQRTGNPLDVTIDGNAYFVVQTARGQRYTRNGAFQVNGAGQLVTSNGDQVLGTGGPITFQNTDHDINISQSGIITVREGNSTVDAPRGRCCRRTALPRSWRRPALRPTRRRQTPAWCRARSKSRTSTASPKWRG